MGIFPKHSGAYWKSLTDFSRLVTLESLPTQDAAVTEVVATGETSQPRTRGGKRLVSH